MLLTAYATLAVLAVIMVRNSVPNQNACGYAAALHAMTIAFIQQHCTAMTFVSKLLNHLFQIDPLNIS